MSILDNEGHDPNGLGNMKPAQAEAADEIERLRTVLWAYEQWEADLIMRNEAWRNGLPTIPQDLWDRFIEIQAVRNGVLWSAKNPDQQNDGGSH